MKAIRLFQLFFWIVMITLNYGCNGEVTGAEEEGGSSGSISYSGSTDQASVTRQNAPSIAVGAYTLGAVGSDIGSVNSSLLLEESEVNLLNLFKEISEYISEAAEYMGTDPTSREVVPYYISEAGNCGGTKVLDADLDNKTNEYAGSITFTNYCHDDVTYSGTMAFSGVLLDTLYLSMSNYSYASGTVSKSITGTIDIHYSLTQSIFLMNLKVKDNSSENVYWIKDYSITTAGDDTVTQQNISSGTFYHPSYGYVSVVTSETFSINAGDSRPSSGTLILTGAGDSKARLTCLTSETYKVEADADGDGTYEWESDTLNWAEGE